MVDVSPFLWFNDDAEEALNFYSRVFEDSEIVDVTRIEVPGSANGGFIVGSLRLGALVLRIMDGGPTFKLNEAFSLVVSCQDQSEVDHYWNALLEGGEPSQCGWLKDRFGLSWQITPTMLPRFLGDADRVRAQRVRDAMMTMSKIECDVLQAAYDG